MARPATQEEREERRNLVAPLLLQHRSISQIASVVGADRKTVESDIRAIRDDWKNQRADAYDRWMAEELPKLALIEAEFFRQMAIDHVVVSEGHVVAGATDEGAKRMAGLAILRVMDQRAKYIGLYAPTKQEVLVLSDDLLEQKRNELLEERERRLRLVQSA